MTHLQDSDGNNELHHLVLCENFAFFAEIVQLIPQKFFLEKNYEGKTPIDLLNGKEQATRQLLTAMKQNNPLSGTNEKELQEQLKLMETIKERHEAELRHPVQLRDLLRLLG